MKIDFTIPLTDLNGVSLRAWVTRKNGEGSPVFEIENKFFVEVVEEELTVGREVCRVLLNSDERDKTKMLHYGHLAKRIFDAGVLDLSIEDVAIILDHCSKYSSILIYTQIYDLLNG